MTAILPDLPLAGIVRWITRRKILLVNAVAENRITLAEVEARYGISAEELAGWQRALGDHGPGALQATRAHLYHRPTAPPVRMRLAPAKGFDLQAASRDINGRWAVDCTRTGRYGNPYIVGRYACACRSACDCGINAFRCATAAEAIAAFLAWRDLIRWRSWSNHEVYIAPIRGRNLACTCAIDAPHCHVDHLLDLANGKATP